MLFENTLITIQIGLRFSHAATYPKHCSCNILLLPFFANVTQSSWNFEHQHIFGDNIKISTGVRGAIGVQLCEEQLLADKCIGRGKKNKWTKVSLKEHLCVLGAYLFFRKGAIFFPFAIDFAGKSHQNQEDRRDLW